MTDYREILHAHLFCGLGGGAKGFNRGQARVGNMVAKFRCIGGIDVDPAAIRDFTRLAGVHGTVLDLFDRSQYTAFHGHEPPADWREATPGDIRKAMGNERPNVWFLSAPCKGFSGLLAENKSKTEKYQSLNRLTLRGIWLALEAYSDDPVELLVFENVPRIANRGRHLLDQIGDLLRHYGYAVAETTHDCGELGGLAQSRKRFLLVARHIAKVPPFVYEPPKRPLAAVGTVLGRMPLPGDIAGGVMHRIPSLQWRTWVRLAFVKAGCDWRSLNDLAVENGHLRDYLIVPDYHRGYLGVNEWNQPAGTVAGHSRATNGNFSVADPRFAPSAQWHDGQAYGVRRWDEPTGTVSSQQSPGQGQYAVADPRHTGPAKHSNEFRIVHWSEPGIAVTSAHGSGQCVADPRPSWEKRYGNLAVMDWERHANTVIAGGKGVQGGWMSVADPRMDWNAAAHRAKLRITRWDQPQSAITGARGPYSGAVAVADPRPNLNRSTGDHYLTGGHYGIVSWNQTSGAVSASACHDNGHWSVADPRVALPAADQKLIARIISEDGTWHRPFTTLELAALQSLIDPEEAMELDGLSDSAWRERIGNAVPPEAAEAIAGVFGQTLLLAWSGETFALGCTPIWVRPIAVALAVTQPMTKELGVP